jgi:hypothetical protein
LQNLLNDNEADLYLTGITVNLLNLRPEVCLLLLIRTEDWYLHHSQNPSDELRFKLNPEYAIMSDSPLTKGVQKLVGRVRYKVIDDEQIKGAPLSPGDMVPPGAAAFWLGRDTLRHVL